MFREEQKYIAFYDVDSNREFAIVFPRWLNHDDMARAIRQASHSSYRKLYPQPISAGFCTFGTDGTVRVSGMSESLRMHHRSSDAELIRDGERAATLDTDGEPEHTPIPEPVKAAREAYPVATKGSTLRARFKGRR